MSDAATELVERYLAAWSKGDISSALACLAPDIVYTDNGVLQVFTGHEEVRAFAETVLHAVPDFTWTAVRTLVTATAVVVEWRFTGHLTNDFPGMPATGKRADVPGISVFEIADGAITVQHDYFNMVDLLQQVGHMPTPHA
jgi:steroid delta-isomerase-like uncharacterized protein